MKRIILLLVLLGSLSPLYAEEHYQDLMRDFKRVYIQMLETKIEKIPFNTTVEVFLKDGTTVRGVFKGYFPHSDALWIRPLGSRFGIFSEEAYDIRQIQDVSIIVLRGV
jgi:hypothetical protein